MKKSAMVMGLGLDPEEGDEADDFEMAEDTEATGDEVAEDQAIDTALDEEADPEERREAFKNAVRLCMKRGDY